MEQSDLRDAKELAAFSVKLWRVAREFDALMYADIRMHTTSRISQLMRIRESIDALAAGVDRDVSRMLQENKDGR